jgi:hypothetical protein
MEQQTIKFFKTSHNKNINFNDTIGAFKIILIDTILASNDVNVLEENKRILRREQLTREVSQVLITDFDEIYR